MAKTETPVVAPAAPVPAATPGPATEPRSIRVQLDRFLDLMPFPLPHIAALFVALAVITALVVIVAGWGR